MGRKVYGSSQPHKLPSSISSTNANRNGPVFIAITWGLVGVNDLFLWARGKGLRDREGRNHGNGRGHGTTRKQHVFGQLCDTDTAREGGDRSIDVGKTDKMKNFSIYYYCSDRREHAKLIDVSFTSPSDVRSGGKMNDDPLECLRFRQHWKPWRQGRMRNDDSSVDSSDES